MHNLQKNGGRSSENLDTDADAPIFGKIVSQNPALAKKMRNWDAADYKRFETDFESANTAILQKLAEDNDLLETWKGVKSIKRKVTRTSLDFLNALDMLKKDTKLQKHIFEADGRQGCHFDEAVDGQKVRYASTKNGEIPTNATTNEFGVFTADIEMYVPATTLQGVPILDIEEKQTFTWLPKKKPKTEPQTFFPPSWTKEEILEQCASALINPSKRNPPGKSRQWEADSDKGITIGWFEPSQGVIGTIFPRL